MQKRRMTRGEGSFGEEAKGGSRWLDAGPEGWKSDGNVDIRAPVCFLSLSFFFSFFLPFFLFALFRLILAMEYAPAVEEYF